MSPMRVPGIPVRLPPKCAQPTVTSDPTGTVACNIFGAHCNSCRRHELSSPQRINDLALVCQMPRLDLRIKITRASPNAASRPSPLARV
jgi:hypothetical protein